MNVKSVLHQLWMAYPGEWRDEGGKDNDASVGKQLGYLADTTNILLTVLWGER